MSKKNKNHEDKSKYFEFGKNGEQRVDENKECKCSTESDALDDENSSECDCGEGCKCAKKGCEKEVDLINNLKAQVEEWQNKYLRAYADAENSKRRAEIDAKNLVDYKISSFAKDMIPLADNLALAISSIKGKVDDGVLTGLSSIQDGFIKALAHNGIVKIETVGKELNPLEHRVVAQVESDEKPETIVQEFQAGYKIGDKVIREAMVATAKPKK